MGRRRGARERQARDQRIYSSEKQTRHKWYILFYISRVILSVYYVFDVMIVFLVQIYALFGCSELFRGEKSAC